MMGKATEPNVPSNHDGATSENQETQFSILARRLCRTDSFDFFATPPRAPSPPPPSLYFDNNSSISTNSSMEQLDVVQLFEVHKRTARSWIEANFQKRECIKFIPNVKSEEVCCCGQERRTHQLVPGIEPGVTGDIWQPQKHTRPQPTDAYGTIEFQGGAHPTKAQYVRLSYDTRPELLVQLFTREWNLELPKLLITVQGGKANFELQPKLKKVLRKGLLKAAKTTGAWIFTGGTNTGVTKQVGDALLLEGQQRSGRVVSIGIAPWGIVERNHELLGHNRDVPCHSISSPRSKLAVLNNRHAYFLLVDNGTQGRYGAELILRRKLEKFISNQKLQPFTHSSTPVVCLVIEGGTNTIRAVLEYVTDSPPVPVVVCDGSGRAADLIAFVHKYATDSGEQVVLESMHDYLLGTIQKTFEVGPEQAEQLYQELLMCTKNKNLITVFRIQDRPEGNAQELDQTILTALFKSQHLSPPEQLSLALTWNRVDIARSEIFVYGQEWPHGALDEAMMQALEHDRIDFVKLLLENGVSMRKFLTIPRLEELYNTKHGPANTLGYILRDVRPHIPRGYVYTLHDIGLVINKLMGGAYRSYYTRRKFRPIYAKVMNSYVNTHRKPSTFTRSAGINSMSLVAGLLPVTSDMALFEFPFNELLIWAVLTKRQQMALLMWTHGEEALAKSLVACKLYKAMAHEAADDDLDTEIYEELRSYAKEFEVKGLKLLDFCYRQDGERAQRLLTCELQSWSSQSCLSLAVAANHRSILAHPCSQIILADLWMGGLRTRKNTNLKVILGLLIPPFVKKLDFKSKEELQQMPQTEEEHLENQCLDYDDNGKHNPDAENAIENPTENAKPVGDQNSTPTVQALLSDTYSMKDTKVQENGKVGLTGCLKAKVSLTDSENTQYKDYMYDHFVRHQRPLKLKKKFYEFYTAPITKFWADSMAYVFFLVLFTYTVLVRMEAYPSWQEVYSIAYITTLGCEKIREIVSSEPVAISHKFSVWAWNMWNPCDAAAIIFFLIGLVLRLRPYTMDVGRVIYCVDSIYWYLRILNILGVNKYLGPLVTMMGKMVKNMIYFVVLLLVVLMSFGVSRQAILFPNNDASWRLVRDVYYQPYFMLYGEVFADDIDPPCGEDPSQPQCVTGHWVTPIAMSMYLLIANILLINLLIAVFNNIFIEVNAVSHQVWMFQRFTVVMEYQQKPVLPPPLIAFCHCYSFLRYLIRKAKGLQQSRDNGLKLFLEKEDMERLYDFEEECIEGYFREQDILLQQSTEERIKNTDERVENMSQKIEDINQKENMQTATVQNIEFRLRKVEESADQILSHLAVIHRFMSAHTQLQDNLNESTGNVSAGGGGGSGGGGALLDVRTRTISESDSTIVPINPRKKINRSLTEVRPDAYIFDDGMHFEVRTVPEENESDRSPEKTIAPSQDRKLSIRSEDSEMYFPPSKGISPADSVGVGSSSAKPKPPFVNVRQDTASTESKDTLTPLENCDDRTLVGEESTDDIIDPNCDGLRQRAAARRRNSSMGAGRRYSESASGYDINKSQTSLYQTSFIKRQQSVTQSEPDSGKEEPVTRPVARGRQLLLQIHAEYTSITDELESVCHMITSPTSSLREDRPKNVNEMSNPEFAALIEKKHLKECEDSDYMMLEKLLQTRCSVDENDDIFDDAHDDYGPRKMLRRETAIELPITPSKSNIVSLASALGNEEFTVKNERQTVSNRNSLRDSKNSPVSLSSQNSPRNSQYLQSTYLNPASFEGCHRIYKKSCESLQKNSSTDTDYSMQPYKFIKQSSNETNSSLNIDNSSITNDLSMDGETSMNSTVIEMLAGANVVPDERTGFTKRASSLGSASLVHPSDQRPGFLKKQFSIDKSAGALKASESIPEDLEQLTQTAAPVSTTAGSSGSGSKIVKSNRFSDNLSLLGTKTMMALLKESSSTSTEDTQTASYREAIPCISTNLVQDEIAKLSSNIKNSLEEETEPPFNETMC
ncbi:transient receptor potential cation channel trpm isoform X5 [Toxorhynchites rutilus septentrionalis]|uniref:transient receptor potential cation channel trpm isoform X5 n=1 Tax=Toxorhynchites rutilus septentrionalis TaxID=329112 RepID=UPI00247A241A|nr:transient receptor potential cation channel trpm isoform X5 [Toxorhynchites rutilus septentrionalis]